VQDARRLGRGEDGICACEGTGFAISKIFILVISKRERTTALLGNIELRVKEVRPQFQFRSHCLSLMKAFTPSILTARGSISSGRTFFSTGQNTFLNQRENAMTKFGIQSKQRDWAS
jgi:hypothetical protein